MQTVAELLRNRLARKLEANARVYGSQVRILEDQGFDRDRERVRKEWVEFRDAIGDLELRSLAVDAYYVGFGPIGEENK